jgi:bifunctional aspartokinase / homoserine dehydrogenase 1
VPDAHVIPYMTYTEAAELAYFGAKVLHPKTMAPAVAADIPVYIRNTFMPSAPCTKISSSPSAGVCTACPTLAASTAQARTSTLPRVSRECVRGFSTVDDLALLNMEGTGMLGVPGMAHRLFGAIKDRGISVMFIAQASSEHSICFAVSVFACACTCGCVWLSGAG